MLCLVNAINNKIIKKIVCVPNGIGSNLSKYAHVANPIPMGKIIFQRRGILTITKANVTTAICSGIPCKSKAISGMLIKPNLLSVVKSKYHYQPFLSSNAMLSSFLLSHTL